VDHHTYRKKEIGIWNAENGNLIAKPKQQLDSSLDCSLSFNRSKIISGGANGESVVWNLNTKTEISSLKSFSNSYLSARLSEDNRKLLLYNDAATKTVDLFSGEVSIDTQPIFTRCKWYSI
jgi:WD40 repeat protein